VFFQYKGKGSACSCNQTTIYKQSNENECITAPELSDEMFFKGKTSVVIDVLRASNTIITALANGAKEIIPVSSVDGAVKDIKRTFRRYNHSGG
jgi:hypothetical protein